MRDYGTAKWEGGDAECDHQYQKGGRNPETAGKQLSNAGTLFSQYEHECKKCGATRIDNQLGLERTPEEYVCHLVDLFRELRRALKDDGTLWLNLGDSFWGGKGQSGANPPDYIERRKARGSNTLEGAQHCIGKKGWTKPGDGKHAVIKPKDLVGIPWMVAFALRADGWHLRADIIWSKPNPMPESVRDRPTKSHEYIFLLSKSAKYYYDNEAIVESAVQNGKPRSDTFKGRQGTATYQAKSGGEGGTSYGYTTRNRRSVWTGKEGRLRLRRDLTPEQVSLVLRRIADGDFLLSSDTDSSSIEHEGDPQ